MQTAVAAELFDPEVTIAAAYPAYQNLDLGTEPSDSFTVHSDSFTKNINTDHSQTNFQVLEEQREELDLEWNLFEFQFNHKYPDPKSFPSCPSGTRKHPRKDLRLLTSGGNWLINITFLSLHLQLHWNCN